MQTYQTNVDIANRACQHVGVTRIVSFSDNSKQASEMSFCYDKLRRAELRRNVWAFATRKVALRAVDTGTMLLSPVAWSGTTTYGLGAIVADSNGYNWQSKVQDNLNNTPGTNSSWDMYCGPLTVSPYDTTGTTGYYAGEIVYETPGDGTYAVYLSLASNNSQDPRAPSIWSTLTQYSKDQVVLYYAAWAVGTTYAAGNVVTYNNLAYVSLAGSNVGHEPDTSPTYWVQVNPLLAPAYYNALTTYSIGQFVTLSGTNYVSLVNNNTGNTPSSSPSDWVAQAAGTYYVSHSDFNMNNNPASSPSLWSTTNHFGNASDLWLTLNCNLTDLQIVYPLGSGPAYQDTTKNIYKLPSNYLRTAPQDPKAGSTSFLGAPTGLMYNDWNYENGYIVTQQNTPLTLRFVADMTEVPKFDDMFCEGLAARIALETVETLTQSVAKAGAIMAQYNKFMTEARMVNGIETGPTEPPEDDYVTCRI